MLSCFAKIFPAIWLTGALLFVFNETTAQQFNIETFTTKEGLTHNDVRSIAADSSGYLWIATFDGLCRYDGYNFRGYYHFPDDTLSLPYFSISSVTVDGGNNLWIKTDANTYALYDRANDHFVRISRIYDYLPETVSGMTVDEEGYLWLVSGNSIFRYDFREKKFDRYELLSEVPYTGNIINERWNYSISITEKGSIWLMSQEVYKFDIRPGKKLILKGHYNVEMNQPFLNKHYSFQSDFKRYGSPGGNNWILSNSGLYLFDEKGKVFRKYRDKIPVNEFRGSDNLIWSDENEGLNIYLSGESGLITLPSEKCQVVQGFCIQKKDIIWFSNISSTGSALGLHRIIFTPGYFRDYPVETEEGDIPAVYAVARDRNGSTWVGLRGKIPVIQIHPDMTTERHHIPGFTEDLNTGAVRTITPDTGGIWIGFFKDLLVYYSFRTGRYKRYETETYGYRPFAIDKNGKLYLSGNITNSKLIRYSPESNRIETRIPNDNKLAVYKIITDSAGIVWVSMNYSTILRYDPVSEETSTFSLAPSNYNIEDICLGNKGDLWLAFLGAGVCNFNPVTGEKRFYTTSDGLANNMTYSVLKDRSGNIWVSTNTGISRIDPSTGMIRSFGIREGLNIIEFNSGASFACSNGELLMGGMGGVTGFFPDSINIDEVEGGDQFVMITEVQVSGEKRNYGGSIREPDTIYLNKGENNLLIFFSSGDYIHSDKALYRYMLSGVNDEWTETDSQNRSVSFANLKPGWYSFAVQVTDRRGRWSNAKELKIRIKPYYYQTTFFRVAVPLLMVLLVAGMIIIYIRQLKQKEAHKQDALRLQSLRGQMNPHFIFNSLNSINYFISNNDKLSANRYIADFSKLIRSILHNMSYDYITLEKEIESVEDYLKIEYMRFGDKFDYNISIDGSCFNGNTKVSPGLIQPFVENAIWHGVRGLETRKGKINIWFGSKDGSLTCTVEDDGIGRRRSGMMKSKNDQKKSKGISIVLERLRIINSLHGSNYKISISDMYPEKQDTGTKVDIDIPIARPVDLKLQNNAGR